MKTEPTTHPRCPNCAFDFTREPHPVDVWPDQVHDYCDWCGKWFTCVRQPGGRYLMQPASPFKPDDYEDPIPGYDPTLSLQDQMNKLDPLEPL